MNFFFHERTAADMLDSKPGTHETEDTATCKTSENNIFAFQRVFSRGFTASKTHTKNTILFGESQYLDLSQYVYWLHVKPGAKETQDTNIRYKTRNE